jgi:hypothetical protein
MEDADSIQEILILAQLGPLLGPVAAWTLHVGDRAVVLPLLAVVFRCPGPVGVTQLLVLHCFLGVEGCFFCHSILVCDGKNLFQRAQILDCEHVDQRRVFETLLEEHTD